MGPSTLGKSRSVYTGGEQGRGGPGLIGRVCWPWEEAGLRGVDVGTVGSFSAEKQESQTDILHIPLESGGFLCLCRGGDGGRLEEHTSEL